MQPRKLAPGNSSRIVLLRVPLLGGVPGPGEAVAALGHRLLVNGEQSFVRDPAIGQIDPETLVVDSP